MKTSKLRKFIRKTISEQMSSPQGKGNKNNTPAKKLGGGPDKWGEKTAIPDRGPKKNPEFEDALARIGVAMGFDPTDPYPDAQYVVGGGGIAYAPTTLGNISSWFYGLHLSVQIVTITLLVAYLDEWTDGDGNWTGFGEGGFITNLFNHVKQFFANILGIDLDPIEWFEEDELEYGDDEYWDEYDEMWDEMDEEYDFDYYNAEFQGWFEEMYPGVTVPDLTDWTLEDMINYEPTGGVDVGPVMADFADFAPFIPEDWNEDGIYIGDDPFYINMLGDENGPT